MRLPVFFLPEAETDLREAQSWYDGRAFGLGDRFFSAIDGTVVRIGVNPMQFPPVHAEIRRALVHRFPYALYFRVEPEGAFVIASVHTPAANRPIGTGGCKKPHPNHPATPTPRP